MDVHFQWGEKIDSEAVNLDITKDFISAVKQNPFCNLHNIEKYGDQEGLIVEFQVELPQNPPVPIMNREIILIILNPDVYKQPQVRALRKDFPETPHQTLTPFGFPKILCLFEEPYEELRGILTPIIFLQRISDWLARAAINELHLSDQQLEPFLFGDGRIFIERNIFDTFRDQPLIAVIMMSEKPIILRAFIVTKAVNIEKDERWKFLLLPIKAEPYHSRLINNNPGNLKQLCTLLSTANIDLEDILRRYIKGLKKTKTKYQNKKIIILLQLPKTREEGGEIESIETWAFIISETVENLSIKLGIKDKIDGIIGVLLGEPISEDLDKIGTSPLLPTFTPSQGDAQKMSGVLIADFNISVIGAGALGSQVVLNLARQGFGNWSIFDDDILLPHNISRHALSSLYIGENKALALEREMEFCFNSPDYVKGFPVNYHKVDESKKEDEKVSILSKSDHIFDFSASSSVLMKLSRENYKASRLSSFLSPGGDHLFLLYEGRGRSVRIDDLEQQLAAQIMKQPALHDIYNDGPEKYQYSGSCRDSSVVLANDVFLMYSSIISGFIKEYTNSTEPIIRLWKKASPFSQLDMIQMPVFSVQSSNIKDWEIRVNTDVITQMHFQRDHRLPNETGGVLLGKIDNDEQVIYVSAILISPPDSIEWPTSYIRGIEGLPTKIEHLMHVTNNELSYIGEWHSHPAGRGSKPSGDDIKALDWLANEMNNIGYPGLMAIIGDEIEPNFLIK
jgi:integrative and conjugative element protein (TIGR02256 family)